jgi:hypothetical protein
MDPEKSLKAIEKIKERFLGELSEVRKFQFLRVSIHILSKIVVAAIKKH